MARAKGAKNKANSELKFVVAAFVEKNSPKFNEWLEEIKINDGPLEAFKRVEALLEYCLPKLARHEGAIDPNANTININIKQYSPVKDK